MSIRYLLSGKSQEQEVQREGTLSEEDLKGVKLQQGSAVVNVAIRNLSAQGTSAQWEKCTIINTATEQEDTYILFKKRWTHQSQIRTRK